MIYICRRAIGRKSLTTALLSWSQQFRKQIHSSLMDLEWIDWYSSALIYLVLNWAELSWIELSLCLAIISMNAAIRQKRLIMINSRKFSYWNLYPCVPHAKANTAQVTSLSLNHISQRNLFERIFWLSQRTSVYITQLSLTVWLVTGQNQASE